MKLSKQMKTHLNEKNCMGNTKNQLIMAMIKAECASLRRRGKYGIK